LWLIEEMPQSKFNFPWPLKNETLNVSLFAAYITESCGFTFQCLYKNVNSFGDYFQRYWAIIASTFANRSSIVGYEILNEPWAGDIYADPLLLLPGVAGHYNLLPLYDQTYATIRRYDKKTLIFYEPVTWGVLLDQNYFGTGFNRPPGGDADTTVLSWHYYCWLLQFNPNPLVNGTYPLFEKVICDQIQIKISFESIRFDMVQLGGGPSFLSEFGVCAFPISANQSYPLNMEECIALLDANDNYLQSWAYWDSEFFDPNTSKVIDQIVDVFSRVYPIATNGLPRAIRFNVTTKVFDYKFSMNVTSLDQAKVSTEIYVPPQIYPNGFQVKLSAHLNWVYDKSINRVLLFLDNDIIQRFYSNEKFTFMKRSKICIYA
jgi:endoglycosylceramidase